MDNDNNKISFASSLNKTQLNKLTSKEIRELFKTGETNLSPSTLDRLERDRAKTAAKNVEVNQRNFVLMRRLERALDTIDDLETEVEALQFQNNLLIEENEELNIYVEDALEIAREAHEELVSMRAEIEDMQHKMEVLERKNRPSLLPNNAVTTSYSKEFDHLQSVVLKR